MQPILKRSLCLQLFIAFFLAGRLSASDTFMDYQNYNHGYCPECHSAPCKCNLNAQPQTVPPTVPTIPSTPPPLQSTPLQNPLPASTTPSCPTCPTQAASIPVEATTQPAESCAPCGGGTEEATASCSAPDTCNPAAICGTNCGISNCWLGLGIATAATAAAIIVGSNNGSVAHHH